MCARGVCARARGYVKDFWGGIPSPGSRRRALGRPLRPRWPVWPTRPPPRQTIGDWQLRHTWPHSGPRASRAVSGVRISPSPSKEARPEPHRNHRGCGRRRGTAVGPKAPRPRHCRPSGCHSVRGGCDPRRPATQPGGQPASRAPAATNRPARAQPAVDHRRGHHPSHRTHARPRAFEPRGDRPRGGRLYQHGGRGGPGPAPGRHAPRAGVGRGRNLPAPAYPLQPVSGLDLGDPLPGLPGQARAPVAARTGNTIGTSRCPGRPRIRLQPWAVSCFANPDYSHGCLHQA